MNPLLHHHCYKGAVIQSQGGGWSICRGQKLFISNWHDSALKNQIIIITCLYVIELKYIIHLMQSLPKINNFKNTAATPSGD